jgi:hypothetical protein
VSATSGVQILEVREISGSPGRFLHRFQIVPRADPDFGSKNVGLGGSRSQLLEARNTVEPLNHVKSTEIRLDCNLFATGQRCGDRERSAKQGLVLLHVATCGYRDLCKAFEILSLHGDDDVDVPGAPHDPPGVQGKSAHHDKRNFCLGEASQQLVEGRLTQLLRAAPAKRISLWLSAMPSARLTLSGRRASSHRR